MLWWSQRNKKGRAEHLLILSPTAINKKIGKALSALLRHNRCKERRRVLEKKNPTKNHSMQRFVSVVKKGCE